MSILYLLCFIAGILFGVRLMFFGAERRRVREGSTPLRRSEPALIALVTMFGLVGYLLTRYSTLSAVSTVALSALIAGAWAVIVTRLAIVTARIVPEVDPEDPRFAFQGRVAVVTREIPADGIGEIRLDEAGAVRSLQARNIVPGGIATGDEVCIERVENDVAFVERWTLVEERL